MNLENIELPEESYNDIAKILDGVFGDITLDKLTDETFLAVLAAFIQTSYKIGFRDGFKIK